MLNKHQFMNNKPFHFVMFSTKIVQIKNDHYYNHLTHEFIN